MVLKSCGDGSEEIIRRFEGRLPTKLIVQSSVGGPVDAYELGYRNSTGDLVLFIDDDAVAHEEWTLRYERFFERHPEAGAAGGWCSRSTCEGTS